jgi:hypothetical protein
VCRIAANDKLLQIYFIGLKLIERVVQLTQNSTNL